jgi:DNA invertase Pin-like site-specific DNA recombinase
MSASLDPPLIPRHGQKLKVLVSCRISGDNQDVKALADQEALYRRWLGEHTELPYDMEVLAGRGSGEYLDREEYLQAIAKVESRQYDLFLSEDLARICRRVHAHIFCETCEDNDTRLISINDHVDTGREDWHLNAFFATMRHEMYNADTAKRIRRSLRNRFTQGGVFQCNIYGLIKPAGAKSDSEVIKDPVAEPVYDEWFLRLENGASYSEVGDWLNDNNIPTGPYCRQKKWTGTMVARVTHNPILKGVRIRNDKVSKRVNKTGHRRSVKAPPQERLERFCPHLVFIEPERYDRVIRLVDQRNACYRRKGVDGLDTRKNVPKKRTAWPGQHLCCGVCGRIYHWTGVSPNKIMMCSGAETYRCWNSVALNGQIATQKLTQAILAEIRGLPDFDEAFMTKLLQKLEADHHNRSGRRQERLARATEVARQIGLVTNAIAEIGSSRSLLDKLRQLEAEQDDLREEERAEQAREAAGTHFLPTAADIRQAGERMFVSFTADDPEIGRLLHRIIPELHVNPYRLCDGGAVVLRARFTLYLARLIPNAIAHQMTEGPPRKDMVVDLFDPPQRVAYRQEVMRLRGQGLTEREVAQRLGITTTAAQRAAALDRQMRALGLTDPYQPIHEPPADYGKLRRHQHPRYRFESHDPGNTSDSLLG